MRSSSCIFFSRIVSYLVPCCSLEFNIHQLVLSDLATNVGDCKDNTPIEDLNTSIDLVTSQVETRAIEDDDAVQVRVFMVSCVISLQTEDMLISRSPTHEFNAT